MAGNSVKLKMEPIIELKIREVALDGQEQYILPRTQSENLVYQASRIDFSEDTSGEETEFQTNSGDLDEDKPANIPSQHWPLEDVRIGIRAALTEISVLADVLRLCKEKSFVVLDPVTGVAPPSRPAAQLVNKRRALNSAAAVLASGAQSLREQSSAARGVLQPVGAAPSETDFHQQLLMMRQRWKLRKFNNMIVGDLGYKSVGSKYNGFCSFEVLRNKEEAKPGEPVPCPLKVKLDNRLRGESYLLVLIRKMPDYKDLSSAVLSLPELSAPSGSQSSCDSNHWQQRLLRAQNVVFCKELFDRLKTDAVEMKSPIPLITMENHISATLFPDIQLTISLQHSVNAQASPPPPPRDRDRVLEHALHALLRAQHRDALEPPPVPASASAEPQLKHRRGLGVEARDMEYLTEAIQPRILLLNIIRYAQHAVVKKRVLALLDNLSRTVSDPQVHVHLSSINNALQSTFRVSLVSSGIDFHPNRTMLSVLVEEQRVRVTQRDGTVVKLSYDPDELHRFIATVICQHQVSVACTLAQQLNWRVLSMSGATGCDEEFGSAASILLTTLTGDKYVGIRCGPTTGNRVFVQSRAAPNAEETQLELDERWRLLSTLTKQVDMDKLEGKNFIGKIELLLSSLGKQLVGS